jgi:hypothetical protein
MGTKSAQKSAPVLTTRLLLKATIFAGYLSAGICAARSGEG